MNDQKKHTEIEGALSNLAISINVLAEWPMGKELYQIKKGE
jgi:hypothetical protein